jgi:hypothetical protein
MAKTRVSSVKEYFLTPGIRNHAHREFLAMHYFFAEEMTANQVAEKFGYTVNTVYTMARDLQSIYSSTLEDPYFIVRKLGRKKIDKDGEIVKLILEYRLKNLSIPDIKSRLNSQNINISEGTIYTILTKEGFVKLPRRNKNELSNSTIVDNCPELAVAPKSIKLALDGEKENLNFSSAMAGALIFWPIIKNYGIDTVIQNSIYPDLEQIDKQSAILSFLALKLTDVEHYIRDDLWCMDRGLGLFAGLNVLPNAACLNSYSSNITQEMNINFLKELNQVWRRFDLLSDTINLDFSAIPYQGDDGPFEDNCSGKQSKALGSLQAVLAQEPSNGILCYGDTTIFHENQKEVIFEFLDFYSDNGDINNKVKFLIFDSKFTTYHHLGELDRRGIKFITIQRTGKNLLEKILLTPKEQWKTITIKKANNKVGYVTASECITNLAGYNIENNPKQIRQIFIKDSGNIKPLIILTNEFDLSLGDIVRKYSKSWLVEKEISQQINFFHLNRNSSGIVVKVDFDLTMTILAHNLFKLLAKELPSYSSSEAKKIYLNFINNTGSVNITNSSINLGLKKKQTMPLLLETFICNNEFKYGIFNNKNLKISVLNTT